MTDTPDTPDDGSMGEIPPATIHPVDPNVDPTGGEVAEEDDDEADARRGRRDRSE